MLNVDMSTVVDTVVTSTCCKQQHACVQLLQTTQKKVREQSDKLLQRACKGLLSCSAVSPR
jgi:hypothetical protein